MPARMGRLLDNTLFVVLVLGVVAITLAIALNANRLHKQQRYFAQQQEILSTAFEASIEMYRVAMDGFYANIISRPDILAVFAEGVNSSGGQRALAKGRLYRWLYPQYQAMLRHNLLQLHFHEADGTSYLRFHKPDRYGDNLLDVRHSVAIVNIEKRPIYGFESGKVRSGFRYVYPLTWQGRHLGSVEASVTIRAIRDAMAKLLPKREYAFLLHRQHTEPFLFTDQRRFYRPSGIHADFIVEDENALLPENPRSPSADSVTVNRRLQRTPAVQSAMREGEALTLGVAVGSRRFLVSLLPIRDIQGHLTAYLVTYTPDPVSAQLRKEFVIYTIAAVLALGMISMLVMGLRRRSAALDREQRNLKVMTDTLAEGVYVMDMAGVIQRVNPAACRMLGYPAEELIGQTAHSRFYRKQCRDATCQQACAFARRIGRGESYDGEERFVTRNGTDLTVEVASRPILLKGRLAGSVTAFHDISERKRAEQALRQSEERARKLSMAVEQSPASVVITDLDGTIEYVNPKFVEKTGYSVAEAVGQNPRILKAGTMDPAVYETMWATITDGHEWKGELHNRRKNGERFWESASISPIRNEQGQTTHYLAVKEDITARKQMEAELREKELFQRTLTEHMPVGLVIVDAQTRSIEMVNPTAAELFGTTVAAIVGNRCHRFLCSAEDGQCPILDCHQAIDCSDRLLRRHDGTQLPVLKTVNRITIQGREKMLECFIDISSRVAAEEALKRVNEELHEAIAKAETLAQKAEAANRSKSVFLANMSHEIRTPLNAILGYSQLLQQDRSISREHLEQVRTINQSGDHLLGLINGILEMSKIEAGHIRVHNIPMNLDRLLDDIQAIFQLTCQKKRLRLGMERIGMTPDTIIADQGKVRQVLVNLMANAVKFTTRGGIELRSTITPDGPERWNISIDVVDSGSGIAPAEQVHLFEAFEQTTSGRQASEGTGLGLSISRAYARSMGGDLVLVRSDTNQGAMFRLTFPAGRRRRDDDAPNIATVPPVVTGLQPGQPSIRALIVEDDPVGRKLLQKLLGQVGFDVRSVPSGEAGLEMVTRFMPQVVLLDVRLPGIDGYETARRIRRLPGGWRMRIIIVTASGVTIDDIRSQAATAGVDDILAKPYNIGELLDKIKALCGIAYTYGLPVFEVLDPGTDTVGQAAVTRLPGALRDALSNAVEMGDMVAFERLSGQVAEIDGGLKDRLTTLARHYDYAALLELLTVVPTGEN